MKSDHGKRPVAQGVGESKRFIAGGTRDPFEHIRGLHMGGQPVEKVVPIKNAHLITYAHTDEGIAERSAGKAETAAHVRSVSGDRARVTATDRDAMLAERYDFRKNELQPWEAPDPMKELVEAHIAKGMRAKFLSPRRMAKDGTRGFDIVKTGNGDPVKLGEMILGQMPEDRAEARNAHYRDKDRARRSDMKRRNIQEEQLRPGAA
jgi:hypothetical protein